MAAPYAVPSRLSRYTEERLLPFGPVQATGRAPRGEAGGYGGCAQHPDHRLRHVEDRPQLPGARWRISGADQQATAPTLFRKTTTTPWAYGVCHTRGLSNFRRR